MLPVQAIRCELAGIEPVGESSVLVQGLFSILCGHVHVFRCVLLCTLHCKSR